MTEQPVERSTTFTLDERDLRCAARLNVFRSFQEMRSRMLCYLAILWGVSLLPFLGYLLGGHETAGLEFARGMSLFALAATALVFAVGMGLPLALSPSIIRRRFRQEKLLSQPVSASWDEEAYAAEQPGVQNRLLWSDYRRWREDRDLFLFMLSDYNFQILPKRALSPEQIADLQAILTVAERRRAG